MLCQYLLYRKRHEFLSFHQLHGAMAISPSIFVDTLPRISKVSEYGFKSPSNCSTVPLASLLYKVDRAIPTSRTFRVSGGDIFYLCYTLS